MSGRKRQGGRLDRERSGQPREVGSRESPVEGRSQALVVVLEAQQSVLDLLDAGEVIGGTKTAGRSRTYTVSAGEMTIFAELYDSETGEVLARVVDRREARSSGRLTLTNSVVNASEARSIASNWARILRNGLDKAHGIGKK
jgi:hypothetical protein